MFGRFSR